MPVANVSPFMFTLTPLLLLMPQGVRRHGFLLISLLSVAMFVANLVGCVHYASIGYKFHPHFLLDYAAHFFLSLYGVYLVRSRQVTPTLKNAAVSASLIVGVALGMMLLNVIFDTSFFGLSLNGKHNIYNNILTKSSIFSALLYFLGLAFVLAIGLAFSRLFTKDRLRIQ